MTYLKENYKSLLAYTGIFFVLLLNSGLVSIQNSSTASYIIKFTTIIVIVILGVLIYRANDNLNYLKLILFITFTNDFHIYLVFLLLTIFLYNKKLILPWGSDIKPIYILAIWSFISFLINQFVEINLFTLPIYFIYFFSGYVYFIIFYKHCKRNDFNEVISFFYNIVLLMAIVISLQIYFLNNLHPDFWHGGTGDAHDAGLIFSISFLLVATNFSWKTNDKSYTVQEILILILAYPIFFFTDSKTFFVLTLITTFIIILIRLENKFKFIFIGVCISLFLLWLNFSDRKLPISIISFKENVYHLEDYSNTFLVNKKADLVKLAIKSFKSDPLVAFIGGGPATFLSYSSVFKKNIYISSKESSKKGLIQEFRKRLYHLYEPADSWLKIKYVGKEYETQPMSSMYDWRSSIINIFFELGLVGIIILMYLIFYFFTLALTTYKKLKTESLVIFILIGFILFLFYISNWAESTKFGIIVYSYLGYFSALVKTINND